MTKPAPRIRKQKARRRAEEAASASAASHDGFSAPDTNTLEILPEHEAERHQRKLKLREEIQGQRQNESRMNSKKKKRLDKYIDTKLRKEENLDLIKKLAAQKVNTSLLQSSKKLGRGAESKREKLGRVLREKRAGIDVGDEENALWEQTFSEERDSSDSEEEKDNELPESPYIEPPPSHSISNAESTGPGFGSGLKRPADLDRFGRPVFQRRKRLKLERRGWEVPIPLANSSEEELSEWGGFSSGNEELEGAEERQYQTPEYGNLREMDGDQNSISEEAETDSEPSASDNAVSEVESQDKQQEKVLLQERASAFKSWASQVRNESIGFVPTVNIDSSLSSQSLLDGDAKHLQATAITEKTEQRVPVASHNKPKSIPVPAMVSRAFQSVFNVPVTRSAEIQESRNALPVVAEEQTIMEAIHRNDVVILWGATGSGKTTQVPQFLFEAGYGNPQSPNPGMIGITQPRRVAAVSMSKRVAVELGDDGEKVSYQIRYDSTVSVKTAVKFMTDGVLMREVAQDFTLSKYSAIVIDEAHERSVNTDILIGMLSRIVETRAKLAEKTAKLKPLKLVIMSATLRTADLIENKHLFRQAVPPVVQAEGRQHPVTTHFSRITKRDYLEETFQKVKHGHRKLPRGAILVFLTGQSEITNLTKRLKQELPTTEQSGDVNWGVRTSATEAAIEDEDIDLNSPKALKSTEDDSDSEAEITGLDNDEENEFNISDETAGLLKMHVLPLYSQLPTDQQMKVFEPPPEGSRLVVLATNVAETSLTIPDVRYVFDCGRAKEKRYDKATGVQSFDVGWISKASANQRAGRAGRTAPGHCYRLYSSAVYERDFPEFAVPEILRTPIEGIVLQLKSLGIPHVVNFPFPTAPERSDLAKAEELLEYLGALSNGALTTIGKELVVYPLSPRLSRIICMAQKLSITGQALALVAALAVADLFVPESHLHITLDDIDEAEVGTQDMIRREQRRREFNSFHSNLSRVDRSSDAMKFLTTIRDFSEARSNSDSSQFHQFARVKALKEAQQLRQQLVDIMRTYKPQEISTTSRDQTLNHKTANLLNHIVAAGYIDQIAIRADLSPTPATSTRKPKRATDVAYLTLFPSWPADIQSILSAQDDEKSRAEVETRLKFVYIHPSSVLAHTPPAKLPQYLVYSHLSRPSNTNSAEDFATLGPKIPKTRIHPLTPISAEQIVTLASGTPLLEDGKPIGKIEMLERDKAGRERRRVYCVPFLKPGKTGGGLGWPLPPARKVVQKRERGGGWVVETIET